MCVCMCVFFSLQGEGQGQFHHVSQFGPPTFQKQAVSIQKRILKRQKYFIAEMECASAWKTNSETVEFKVIFSEREGKTPAC